MTNQGDTRAAHLSLLIKEDGYVPLYLQLVHQIRHLITSHGLAADDRLPSVRELAQQLGVNPGTVALSYRTLQLEGLIESRRGRGTFVSHVSDIPGRLDHRQRALGEAVDALLDRADALGFDANAVKQHIVARAQRPRRLPYVVAMPDARGASKYAGLIAAELPSGIEARPHGVTLAELLAGDERVLDLYRTTFFTFAFMSHAPTVVARLAEFGLDTEVIGITAQLTPATIERLRALDPGGAYCLVGEAHNANVAVNLLSQYTALDLRRIPVFTEHSTPEELAAARPRLYIHTFAAGPRLDALGVPQGERLELVFSLSDEARLRVRRLFDGAGPAAANAPDIFLDA